MQEVKDAIKKVISDKDFTIFPQKSALGNCFYKITKKQFNFIKNKMDAYSKSKTENDILTIDMGTIGYISMSEGWYQFNSPYQTQNREQQGVSYFLHHSLYPEHIYKH